MKTQNLRRRTTMLAATLSAIMVPALAHADDGVEAGSDGLSVKTGDLELNLGGRLHLDATVFDHGLDDGSEADVRRARLEFSAKLGDVIQVRADREFAQADGWRNLWVGVTPVEGFEVRGGNQIVPFSMEDMGSSNTMALAERSLANALSPAFGLGGMARYHTKNFTIAGGYFTDALDDEVGQSRVRGDGFTVRATFAPVTNRDGYLHFGAAYENRSYDVTEPPRFTAISASSLAPSLLRTGALNGATGLDAYNAEFAYARGSVHVQAQYIGATVSRVGLPDLDYAGWYAQTSWMVTGEKHGYSRSTGTPLGPRIGKKGGAIELAARYSELDLDDASLDRGRASIANIGATWYLNQNIRVLANYARTETNGSLLVPDASGTQGDMRFQVAF